MPLVFVDPAYTSQMCCECQHVDKRNHVGQGLFICRGGGSLPTPTGMLPTTSPNAARACGKRGVSHASLPPHNGVSGRRSPFQQPAGTTSKPRPLGPGHADCRCKGIIVGGRPRRCVGGLSSATWSLVCGVDRRGRSVSTGRGSLPGAASQRMGLPTSRRRSERHATLSGVRHPSSSPMQT